jgi:glycosyltransferase involved in cell wall biosynthesis
MPRTFVRAAHYSALRSVKEILPRPRSLNPELPARQPLVTIITTVHNLERYVERCISSVIDQTYSNWEQIIVDDGSSDSTEYRIAQFKDPRIRYIRLPHRGLGALADSYNVAFKAGTGLLVAVLEGDDYWPTDKLAEQVPAFADPEIQLTWGRAIVVDEQDRQRWMWPRPALPRQDLSMEELFRRLTRTNILTPTVTVMARRPALEKIGGFHQPAGALFVDLPTWLRLTALAPGKARMLDALLGYYRVHQAQMSTQHDFSYRTSQARVVDAVVSELSPSTRERLGWNDARRREARASAELTTGIAYLRSGNRSQARRNLVSALRVARSPRESLRAMLGVVSTLIPYDLVAAADRARRAILVAALRRARVGTKAVRKS